MILLFSALDPTGLSGMARDIAAATDQGRATTCLLSATVAENSKRVASIQFRPVEELKQDLNLVLEECRGEIRAIKIGLVHPSQLTAILPTLKKLKKPLVLDTVLAASAGDSFGITPSDWLPLLKEVDLWTPNRSEMEAILGVKKANLLELQAVLGPGGMALVTSWQNNKSSVTGLLFGSGVNTFLSSERMDNDPRGTGCTLSTLIACGLDRGLDLEPAVAFGMGQFKKVRALQQNRRMGLYQAQVGEVLHQLALAVPRLERLPAKPILAEVGMNLAFCLEGATGPEYAAAFSSRIVDRGGLLHISGYPLMGGSSHVARVAVQAHLLHKPYRTALNLRHSEVLLKQLDQAGLKGASFRRQDEPKNKQNEDAHTMDWGVREAFKKSKTAPDFIADKGGPGKEPMIRLLGRSPSDVLDKLEKTLGLDFLKS